MKTLIATDGSKDATEALRAAGRLLRKDGNEVTVLCVAPDLDSKRGKVSAEVRDQYRRRIGAETKTLLEEARQALRAEGIEPELVSEIGSPADVIVRLSKEHDVTVVGARAKYQSPNLGLGPVASRVVEHGAGVVLVARPLSNETNLRVLAGVDGSLASEGALTRMQSCFNLGSGEITLMHVVETPWIHLGLDREWLDYPGDVFQESDPEVQLERELQREALAVVDEARGILADFDYSVLTSIAEGNPATEMVGEAESGDYDLIVMGASGETDTKHQVLGSVSAKVAWQAPCSVAIVKSTE